MFFFFFKKKTYYIQKLLLLLKNILQCFYVQNFKKSFIFILDLLFFL